MPDRQSFYITTPIYYVNDKPHIGHAYTTIAADARARFERLRGKDVFFLCGTDENSQKSFEAASKIGETDLGKYLDRMSAVFTRVWKTLAITNDDFIRTTEPRHHRAVEKFWRAVAATGDIYKGKYEGLYCIGCEAFKKESDLTDGLCPDHRRAPERIVEENYFFRLTKYRGALLEWLEKNPEIVGPESRRHEITRYITDFMEDISISRQNAKCGIPVPGDDRQAIYVWFDALINYLSAIGYGDDETRFQKYWPGTHLVGKEIIKFHCALWPAMLMSAGLPPPARVFAHGFFTIEGQKISKSLGNAIDPMEIVERFGNDTLRYGLLREMHFGEDGDFSLARLEERYRTELAGALGNLVYRVLVMTEKYTAGKIPERSGANAVNYLKYDTGMERFAFHECFDVIWGLVYEANRFVDEMAPWKLAKLGETEKLRKVLYELLETLRHIGRMLLPLLPTAGGAILEQLAILEVEQTHSWKDGKSWGLLVPGNRIKKTEPLFPPLAVK